MWEVLNAVPDPEIPVVSVVELGIVREVSLDSSDPRVVITPTYSGCPATDVIHGLIRKALDDAGFDHLRVQTVIAPPWTTDWISKEGHKKLRAYGIAPPERGQAVRCPRCASDDVEKISEFGSTPCKSHYRCKACLEPFDRFKCH